MNFLRPTLLTLACLAALPCTASDLPSLGDASSAIVSPQQEHQLGRAWLSLLRGQVSQLSDPQLKDFVENSVYRLEFHAEGPAWGVAGKAQSQAG